MGFIEEDGTSCPSMITEWMENGSLKQFLQANDNVNILFMVCEFISLPLELRLTN